MFAKVPGAASSMAVGSPLVAFELSGAQIVPWPTDIKFEPANQMAGSSPMTLSDANPSPTPTPAQEVEGQGARNRDVREDLC